LLQSQFADLEEPQPGEAVVIELGRSPAELVQEIRRKLELGKSQRPNHHEGSA
jgi:gluconate kinase